jgi:cytolysin-activating lysine-acyltransferase
MIFEARKKDTITEDAVLSAAGKIGIASPPHAPGRKEPVTKSAAELAQGEVAIQSPPARNASASTKGALGLRMAQSFAQIVAVLMRDPSYKGLRVTDLEWLVLPPVMAGQFRLAHATVPTDSVQPQQGGILVPVAAALWARVSPQVDKALSETLEKPVQLSQGAWTSGDIPWLMAVAGDRRTTRAFLRQLQENEFKGKQVKMRLRGSDGKLAITSLDQHTKAA